MKKTVIFLLFFCISALFAELPPYVYDNLKQAAAEEIVMEVKKVRTSFFAIGKKEVTLEIKVVSVQKSKSGLKAGDLLTVFYLHEMRPLGMVGPSTLPLLDKNKIYHAYLTFDDVSKRYVPAARGQSFEPLE